MMLIQISLVAIFTAVAHSQVGSQDLIDNIDSITDLSSQTNDVAQSISFNNVFSTAPMLIDDFRQIIQFASEDIASMGNPTRRKTKRELLDSEQARRYTGSVTARAASFTTAQKRQASPPYTETNQLQICDAFREFVAVHEALLATVIGKHGLLAQTPFTQPTAQVLRQLEGGVDTLAFSIIDIVPTCAEETTEQNNALDVSLQDAVNTYDS